MSLVVVDVESDGFISGDYSMIAFGAVVVEPGLSRTFEAKLEPISPRYIPEALAVSGFTRQQTLHFPEASLAMIDFKVWLLDVQRPVFISDNNGFDWQFINWYFHHFLGENPFGFSSRRIGDLYCGMVKDMRANNEWKKKYRGKYKHCHNALIDCLGNANALLEMQKLGLKL